MNDGMNLELGVDTSALTDALDDLERRAGRFGDAFGAALRGATVEGRAFEDVLRTLALRMSSVALDSALAPLEAGASNLFGALAGGLSAALTGGTTASAQPPARAAPAVTFNVTTPDAASFRRSEGQIAAMLARTTIRGQRSL